MNKDLIINKEYKPLICYPDQIEIMLEFKTIKNILLKNRISELSSELIDSIQFYTDIDIIKEKLNQTSEFKNIIELKLNFPVDNYIDIRDCLKILEIENSTLSAPDFSRIRMVSDTIIRIVRFFKQHEEKFPVLYKLLINIKQPDDLLVNIDKIIDEEGIVRSNASVKLSALRKSIKKTENEIDQEFNRILNYSKKNGWLSDEIQTVRYGERVLAVNVNHKRKIKGIIVDQSSTGKTCFIQPETVLSLNNELFGLHQDEKREIHLILNQLSAFTQKFIPDLYFFQTLLANLDFIRTKALFATDLSAVVPEILDRPVVDIQHAFHPLLLIVNKSSGKMTVPLNLKLDEENRILVISGPNAGGKSVCLKTIGILQMMLQSGLMVPVSPDSVMGVFRQLFIDIGDNQSIENDLSTYSSHLKNLKHFVENANEHTLFLIDEFGSGTEPLTGGIIAETILAVLNEKKSFGIVTTHYSNLKKLASETPGINNAAFKFDIKLLKPTYQLIMNVPGSSYSFELLRNIGIEKNIIEIIRNKLKEGNASWDLLAGTLQDEKSKLEEKHSKLREKEIQLDRLLIENKNLKIKYDQLRNTLRLETKENADEYLFNINRRFEKLILDWKHSPDDNKKENIKKVKTAIHTNQEKIKSEIRKLKLRTEKNTDPSSFKVGTHVKLKSGSQTGKIISLRGDRVKVVFGNIKSEVKMSDLEIIIDQEKEKKQKIMITTDLVSSSVIPIVDVRGMRREEALQFIEKYIDKALLSHFKTLRIIHGTGEGILRPAIRTLLKKYDFIIDISSDKPEAGGDGVTIVTLE